MAVLALLALFVNATPVERGFEDDFPVHEQLEKIPHTFSKLDQGNDNFNNDVDPDNEIPEEDLASGSVAFWRRRRRRTQRRLGGKGNANPNANCLRRIRCRRRLLEKLHKKWAEASEKRAKAYERTKREKERKKQAEIKRKWYLSEGAKKVRLEVGKKEIKTKWLKFALGVAGKCRSDSGCSHLNNPLFHNLNKAGGGTGDGWYCYVPKGTSAVITGFNKLFGYPGNCKPKKPSSEKSCCKHDSQCKSGNCACYNARECNKNTNPVAQWIHKQNIFCGNGKHCSSQPKWRRRRL